jgi:hypothetical protein
MAAVIPVLTLAVKQLEATRSSLSVDIIDIGPDVLAIIDHPAGYEFVVTLCSFFMVFREKLLLK